MATQMALTFDQMQQLESKGFKTASASMLYKDDGDLVTTRSSWYETGDTYAYTLNDILEIFSESYCCDICISIRNKTVSLIECGIKDYKMIKTIEYENIFDALFELLIIAKDLEYI